MASQNVPIQTLLHEVRTGEIVLPDFQRPFVWDPDDVRDLLLSVFGDYYVGTMLYMDAYFDQSPFALRLISGVRELFPSMPQQSFVKILLDGQQRTSALFYSLYAPPVPLRDRKSPHQFFVHVPSFLDHDWEHCVEFANVGNTRAVRALEQDDNYFPLTSFRDTGELSQRILASKFKDAIATLISSANRFMTYQIQMIHLPRDTSLERVVETFERINRTGQPLSVTDLLVARLYRDNIKLRAMVEDARGKYSFLSAENKIDDEHVLRVICLLRGVEVRRRDILELRAECFTTDWNDACGAMETAFRRLRDARDGYGVIDYPRWVPFTSAIVPLAALIAWTKRANLPESVAYKKIDQWYWAAIFSNRYNEAVNTNIVADYKEMKEWFNDERKIPDVIRKLDVDQIDLNVEIRSSAIFKAVMCLVAKKGAKDFETGHVPELAPKALQDDHIFPKRFQGAEVLTNRTLIHSNQRKSDKAPSEYFGAIKTLLGEEELLKILETHLIDRMGYEALLRDDIEAFCRARATVIRKVIGELVGAPER